MTTPPASPPQHTALPVKLIIGLTSLLLSIGALELGMRLAGHAYLARTVLPEDRIDLSPQTHRILCVGDSFTFGGRTSRDATYPALLERSLTPPAGERYQVINRGVCEYNTRQVLELLPEWLDLYQPELVLVLVGAANRFNPQGYGWDQDTGGLARLSGGLQGLRVVKMARFISLALQGRSDAWRGSWVHYDGSPRPLGVDGRSGADSPYMEAKRWLAEREATELPGSDPLSMIWYLHNQGELERAIRVGNEALASHPDDEELTCSLGYFHYRTGQLEQAHASFSQALERFPSSGFVHALAAFFYSNAGRDALLGGNPDQAIPWLFEAMPLIPDDEYVYYAMSKAYSLQSTHSAQVVLDRCHTLVTQHPELANNPKLMNHIAMFERAEGWDRTVESWLEEDLDAIVRAGQASGARVVLGSYPVPYELANRQLQAAADRHGLQLVDHQRRFTQLLEAEPADRYLFDDDHCTEAGHEVMAREVERVLTAE